MSSTLPDMTGRTVVVTGATNGIGLWTALGLVQAGAAVTIVGRSEARLATAADWISRRGGRGRPRSQVADFMSLRAVQALADRLAMRLDRLDVLVNNAGLISPERRLSADGYELTFAVNHLAPFLLTRALLPSLRRAPAGRVVTVSSTAHLRGRIAWDDPTATRGYGAMTAYAQSKLANILFTTELARRLEGSSVTANCLHPGLVGTGFGEVGGWMGLAWRLGHPFMLSPERGAKTSLFLATSPSVADVSGRYFARSRETTPSAAARDSEAAARLWQESEALVDRALGATSLQAAA